MHHFSMITSETRPEGPDMNLELVKAEGTDTLQEGIQMILEPSPDFPGGHPLRRSGVGASLINGWEVRQMLHGGRMLAWSV